MKETNPNGCATLKPTQLDRDLPSAAESGGKASMATLLLNGLPSPPEVMQRYDTAKGVLAPVGAAAISPRCKPWVRERTNTKKGLNSNEPSRIGCISQTFQSLAEIFS